MLYRRGVTLIYFIDKKSTNKYAIAVIPDHGLDEAEGFDEHDNEMNPYDIGKLFGYDKHGLDEFTKQITSDHIKQLEKNKIDKLRSDIKSRISGKTISGGVNLSDMNITNITDVFDFTGYLVDGSFDCSNCRSLASLQGAPSAVGEDFMCSDCTNLTSLQGAPSEVGREFRCSYCHSLTSLQGAPSKVGEDFSCSYCRSLASLQGAPSEVGGSFRCHIRSLIK